MGNDESSISSNSKECDLNSRTNALNSDDPAWNSKIQYTWFVRYKIFVDLIMDNIK